MRLTGRPHGHGLTFEVLHATDMLGHNEMQAAAPAGRAEHCDLRTSCRRFVEIFQMFDDHVTGSVEESSFKGFGLFDLNHTYVQMVVPLRHFADGKDDRRPVVIAVGESDSLHAFLISTLTLILSLREREWVGKNKQAKMNRS